jgi:hypothetical protein
MLSRCWEACLVGYAVGDVPVPAPQDIGTDATSPVDDNQFDNACKMSESGWALGANWAADEGADPEAADTEDGWTVGDHAGDDGWASDWWGDSWPLGDPAASTVPALLSIEPDRPVDLRDGLASVLPGPALAEKLAALRPADLSASDLVDLLVGWERLARWAQAHQAAAVAELSRRPVYHPDQARDEADELRSAGCEVALALKLAPATGQDRVVTARRLMDEFPATLAALRSGEIDWRRATLITEVADRVSLDVAHRVEERVLTKAGGRTLGQHRRAIERAILAVDPTAAEERHARAAASRRVCFYPLEDGMGALTAELTADGLAAVRAVLDAAASALTQVPGETRSVDQLRADALVDLARISLATGWLGGVPGEGVRLGTAQGRRAHIHVTVPYSTLIGLDQHPGELTGYGPIPASIARRIAAEGVWRRLLTDPATGALLDYGRTTYQPPADLRDHVITRDRTCILPVCGQPAHRCQLDHTTGYPDGPTTAGNLGPPCGPHHDLKTRLHWRLQQPEPGRFVWTTPAGKTYTRDPEPIGPILDDDDPAHPTTGPTVDHSQTAEYTVDHDPDPTRPVGGDKGPSEAPTRDDTNPP